MTRELAIECIKTQRQFVDDQTREAFEMAIEALKNEPRGVIYSGDGYADGHMVYDLANCPACNFAYEAGDKDWGEPFCPHCGQPLIWEIERREE